MYIQRCTISIFGYYKLRIFWGFALNAKRFAYFNSGRHHQWPSCIVKETAKNTHYSNNKDKHTIYTKNGSVKGRESLIKQIQVLIVNCNQH